MTVLIIPLCNRFWSSASLIIPCLALDALSLGFFQKRIRGNGCRHAHQEVKRRDDQRTFSASLRSSRGPIGVPITETGDRTQGCRQRYSGCRTIMSVPSRNSDDQVHHPCPSCSVVNGAHCRIGSCLNDYITALNLMPKGGRDARPIHHIDPDGQVTLDKGCPQVENPVAGLEQVMRVSYHQIEIACRECATTHPTTISPDLVVRDVLLQNSTHFLQIGRWKVERGQSSHEPPLREASQCVVVRSGYAHHG